MYTPVIIQQGKAKILAMAGVVVGISDEKNEEIANNQMGLLKERNDKLTASLMEDQKIEELADLLKRWVGDQ